MKRLQAINNLVEAAQILRRVRDEFLATKQAWPRGKQSIQHEINNIEDLAEALNQADGV